MLKRKNNVKAWKTGQLFPLTPGSQNTNQRTYVASPSSPLHTSSPPFSKPTLSSTFLPLDPCFLNRSLSRRKPHNNPLSRLLWGLIFLLKNAIKTHNLATKTHKNSAKTLKNA